MVLHHSWRTKTKTRQNWESLVHCSFSLFIVLNTSSHVNHSNSKTGYHVDGKDGDDDEDAVNGGGEKGHCSAANIDRWGTNSAFSLNSVIPVFCLSEIFPFSDVSLKKNCCKQQTSVSTWLQFGIQFRLARLSESRKLWMGQRREERGMLWEEGEKEEETRRSLLSAGSSWWTESGESGHGSQTRDNTCTLHHGSHTPWCTGGRGTRGTGSTQSYKYKRKKVHILLKI